MTRSSKSLNLPVEAASVRLREVELTVRACVRRERSPCGYPPEAITAPWASQTEPNEQHETVADEKSWEENHEVRCACVTTPDHAANEETERQQPHDLQASGGKPYVFLDRQGANALANGRRIVRLVKVGAALGAELHNCLVNFQAFGPEIGIALWAPKIPEIVNSKTNADGNNRGENQPHSDLKIDSADDKDDHGGGHKQRAAPFDAVGHAQSFLKVFGDCHGGIRWSLGDWIWLVRFAETDSALRTEGNEGAIHLQVRRLERRVALRASHVPRRVDVEPCGHDQHGANAKPSSLTLGYVEDNHRKYANDHRHDPHPLADIEYAELLFQVISDCHDRESYRDAQGVA